MMFSYVFVLLSVYVCHVITVPLVVLPDIQCDDQDGRIDQLEFEMNVVPGSPGNHPFQLDIQSLELTGNQI